MSDKKKTQEKRQKGEERLVLFIFCRFQIYWYTLWHSAKIGDLRRRAHVHNTVNRPLNVFWVIHTAFLSPAALRAPLCHRPMGPRRHSEVALVAGPPSDCSSCEDTKPCLRCAIPKWSAHNKCNQHLKAARGGRSCTEEGPMPLMQSNARRQHRGRISKKRCAALSVTARGIGSGACCAPTRWTALKKAARDPAARVRPKLTGCDTRRNYVLCSQTRKPAIVEIDSAEDFTAEERAQTDRIKANAQKRRREREMTPPPAPTPKKTKSDAPLSAAAIQSYVSDGIAAAMGPLLDRLDNNDTSFQALHRRIVSLEYAYSIYSPMCI